MGSGVSTAHLLLVVEDSAGIRPVTGGTAVGQHVVGGRLLEQEPIGLQLVLLLLGHATKRVVGANEVAGHLGGGSGSAVTRVKETIKQRLSSEVI